MFFDIEWQKIFVPDVPLIEIFLRGSLTYLGLFCLLRVVLKRQAGAVGMTDMLVIVLIADAAQNGMSSDYSSLSCSLMLVCTIIFWNYTLEWLGYHFPLFEKMLHPPPLMLIKDGKMLHRNMRREFITKEEIISVLHHHGLDDIKLVRKACMEGDGAISVMKYEDNSDDTTGKKKKLA